jgi:hypothetical protein
MKQCRASVTGLSHQIKLEVAEAINLKGTRVHESSRAASCRVPPSPLGSMPGESEL